MSTSEFPTEAPLWAYSILMLQMHPCKTSGDFWVAGWDGVLSLVLNPKLALTFLFLWPAKFWGNSPRPLAPRYGCIINLHLSEDVLTDPSSEKWRVYGRSSLLFCLNFFFLFSFLLHRHYAEVPGPGIEREPCSSTQSHSSEKAGALTS